MVIHDVYTLSDGKQYQVRYVDADSFTHILIAEINKLMGFVFTKVK